VTRPTARVLALLEILERGGTHRAAQLAAELGVDERTVRRYIEHLVDIGIPIESVRGRYGGFRLTVGERMPPLMLTEDEALAVSLGLVAAQRSGLVGAAGAAESAGRKVRGSLPAPSARRLEAVLRGAAFTEPVVPAAAAETRVLLLLAEAARERRPLWFRYTARDGRASARTLLPYGVVAHAGRWYATGHDSLSGQVRTFRLDRMLDPSLLPGAFDVPPGFNPVEAVLGSLATTPWAHDVRVVVRGAVDEVRRAVPRDLATVDEVADATPDEPWSRVRLRAERLDWVAALLAGLNREFVIESPDELRASMRGLADRLAAAADGSGADADAAPGPGSGAAARLR
jgi:predicted DNA-binding transcriptional regulator YafY